MISFSEITHIFMIILPVLAGYLKCQTFLLFKCEMQIYLFINNDYLMKKIEAVINKNNVKQ